MNLKGPNLPDGTPPRGPALPALAPVQRALAPQIADATAVVALDDSSLAQATAVVATAVSLASTDGHAQDSTPVNALGQPEVLEAEQSNSMNVDTGKHGGKHGKAYGGHSRSGVRPPSFVAPPLAPPSPSSVPPSILSLPSPELMASSPKSVSLMPVAASGTHQLPLHGGDESLEGGGGSGDEGASSGAAAARARHTKGRNAKFHGVGGSVGSDGAGEKDRLGGSASTSSATIDGASSEIGSEVLAAGQLERAAHAVFVPTRPAGMSEIEAAVAPAPLPLVPTGVVPDQVAVPVVVPIPEATVLPAELSQEAPAQAFLPVPERLAPSLLMPSAGSPPERTSAEATGAPAAAEEDAEKKAGSRKGGRNSKHKSTGAGSGGDAVVGSAGADTLSSLGTPPTLTAAPADLPKAVKPIPVTPPGSNSAVRASAEYSRKEDPASPGINQLTVGRTAGSVDEMIKLDLRTSSEIHLHWQQGGGEPGWQFLKIWLPRQGSDGQPVSEEVLRAVGGTHQFVMRGLPPTTRCCFSLLDGPSRTGLSSKPVCFSTQASLVEETPYEEVNATGPSFRLMVGTMLVASAAALGWHLRRRSAGTAAQSNPLPSAPGDEPRKALMQKSSALSTGRDTASAEVFACGNDAAGSFADFGDAFNSVNMSIAQDDPSSLEPVTSPVSPVASGAIQLDVAGSNSSERITHPIRDGKVAEASPNTAVVTHATAVSRDSQVSFLEGGQDYTAVGESLLVSNGRELLRSEGFVASVVVCGPVESTSTTVALCYGNDAAQSLSDLRAEVALPRHLKMELSAPSATSLPPEPLPGFGPTLPPVTQMLRLIHQAFEHCLCCLFPLG